MGVPEIQPRRRLRRGGSGAGPRQRGRAGVRRLAHQPCVGRGSVLNRRTGLLCSGRPYWCGMWGPPGSTPQGRQTGRPTQSAGGSPPVPSGDDPAPPTTGRRPTRCGTWAHSRPVGRGSRRPLPHAGGTPPPRGETDGPFGSRQGDDPAPTTGPGRLGAGSGHTPARWETDGLGSRHRGQAARCGKWAPSRRGESALRRRPAGRRRPAPGGARGPSGAGGQPGWPYVESLDAVSASCAEVRSVGVRPGREEARSQRWHIHSSWAVWS